MTPEEKAARLAALDAADAADEEGKQKRLDALTRADYEEEQKQPGLHWGAAAQTLGDLGNVGAQGLTLGYSDEMKAALITALGNMGLMEDKNYDPSYETVLKDEQRKLRDAKVRMNAETPGSGATFEGLTSLVGPGALAKKVSEVGNPLLRAGASVGTGAGVGGVSAQGHGEDPLTGMAVGTAGGMLEPIAAMGGAWAPGLGASTGMGAGSWLGQHFGPTISTGLTALGGYGGYQAGKAAKTAAQSPEGRDLLAKLAMTPGALWGQIRGQ